MDPTVSIVINNHNYERYVGSAIESALSQDYSAIEVVVVDDGSTDGSRDVIGSYADRVLVEFKENGGQTSAMNAGFARATGDIVCFLDADDVLLPTAATAAAELLSEAGVARGVWALQAVDSDGLIHGLLPKHAMANADAAEILSAGDPMFAVSPTSSNVWARPFLETVFPLAEIEGVVGYGSAMADAFLCMASLGFGETRSTPEVHGRYLIHGANDFARRDVHGQLAMHMAVLPHHFERLESYAIGRGFAADPKAWRRNGHWFRLARATKALAACAPRVGQIAIVDDGWRVDVGAPFDATTFIERSGGWSGVPDDDDDALRELERARVRGVGAIAFLWPSFWWLDHYGELAAHLRTDCRVLVDTDDVVAFDVRDAPRPATRVAEREGPRPLFLLGLHRGGTTYVQRLLNLHPEITLWGENGGLVTGLRAAFEGADELRTVESPPSDSPESALTFVPWAAPFDRPALLGALRELLIGLYGTDVGTYWGFKEIRHGDPADLDFLQLLFSHGRLLMLVRHPRDVLFSELRTAWEPPFGEREQPDYVEQFLVRYARTVEAFVRARWWTPDVARVFRYEDLLDVPGVQSLFSWLGLDTGAVGVDRLLDVQRARLGSSRDLGRPMEPAALTDAALQFEKALPGVLGALDDDVRRALLDWYPDLDEP